MGVRQRCILLPALFTMLFKRIMENALDGFPGGARCGQLTISNLRFVDDLELITKSRASRTHKCRTIKKKKDGNVLNATLEGYSLDQVTGVFGSNLYR